MAPLAEIGGFLGGLEGLGQQVGSHFLLPPGGERPPLLGDHLAQVERGSRGGGTGVGTTDLAHLQGILRRRQLYCRTGFHLQILPDGTVQGTRQDHSLFGKTLLSSFLPSLPFPPPGLLSSATAILPLRRKHPIATDDIATHLKLGISQNNLQLNPIQFSIPKVKKQTFPYVAEVSVTSPP